MVQVLTVSFIIIALNEQFKSNAEVIKEIKNERDRLTDGGRGQNERVKIIDKSTSLNIFRDREWERLRESERERERE